MELTLGRRTLRLERSAAVMAIVNRTPDSFYDKGATYALETAVEHALAQVEAGADIVDVGGVKAGPGDAVTEAQERERIVPFVEAFRARSDAPLSVDTFRARIAAEALDAGADLVNDVSGMVEPEIAEVVAARPGTALVVMHAGPTVRTRPFRPTYAPDVTTAVVRRCRELAEEAQRRGVAAEQIVVDPGHDFAKNTVQSLEVTRRLPELAALGYPVLVALSRKDFLGEVVGLGIPPAERLEASLAAAAASVLLGARIVRVHDTAATVRAVRTVEAILGWRPPAASVRGLE
jgi:dihydropteroate synthase